MLLSPPSRPLSLAALGRIILVLKKKTKKNEPTSKEGEMKELTKNGFR
jgi:hypothetical protein